jgi:hypothetical protein
MNPQAKEFVFNITAKEWKPPAATPNDPVPPSAPSTGVPSSGGLFLIT